MTIYMNSHLSSLSSMKPKKDITNSQQDDMFSVPSTKRSQVINKRGSNNDYCQHTFGSVSAIVSSLIFHGIASKIN